MEWKDVEGYEGIYMVSRCGKVKSLDRIVNMGKKGFRPQKGVVLKPSKNRYGYLFVNLQSKSKKIHRLVAIAFLENPESKREVNHIDGNKENNNVDNLEWSTRSENMKHAFRAGLTPRTYGEGSLRRKLTKEQVLDIRRKYREKEMNQVELAKHFNIGQTTVSEIVRYEAWKDVE